MMLREYGPKIEGRRLDPECLDVVHDIADWCGGTLLGNQSIEVDTGDEKVVALPGDWVILDDDGFAVMTDDYVRATYEEVLA